MAVQQIRKGDRVRIVKGCRALKVRKGDTATVDRVLADGVELRFFLSHFADRIILLTPVGMNLRIRFEPVK